MFRTSHAPLPLHSTVVTGILLGALLFPLRGMGVPPFEAPVSGEIGPKGGKVKLPNGVEVLVGPGAFKSPTTVHVFPADGVPTRGGVTLYKQVGWSFRVEPSLKNAKVNVRVPVALTPPGYAAYMLKLDLIGPPICDREKCKGNFYMSCSIRDDFAWFDVSGLDTPNVLQVAVRKSKNTGKVRGGSLPLQGSEHPVAQPTKEEAAEKTP